MYFPIVVININIGSYDIKIGTRYIKFYSITPMQFTYIAQCLHYIKYDPNYRSYIDGAIIETKDEQIIDKIQFYIENGSKL
jgi:hypothetical protein